MRTVGVCLVACVVLWDDLTEAVWDLERAAFDSSGKRDFWLLCCTGYMHYDAALILCNYGVLGDWSMLVHHAVVFSGLQIGVQKQAGTFYMAVCA
jgi:hypothetical protein